MKKVYLLTILGVLALGTSAFAAGTVATPGVFSISATMPSATDVTFVTSKVDATSGAFSSVGSGSGASLTWAASDLTFLTGTAQNPINIWSGKHYYAIDLTPSQGVGGNPSPASYSSITFAYSGETVPAGQPAGAGLGTRAILTVVQAGGATEPTVRASTALKNVGSITAIKQADLTGGWVRCYVGLYTGNPAVTDAVPLTNADKPGQYTGTLTISVTLT